MSLNGNLRKPKFYRQMGTMRISEPQGEILPKYSPGGNPPQQDQTLAPNREGGHQIKQKKSFDNQQAKNS
jgi:hypothetical protein